MGRTNMIILALGLITCLTLSLAMEHVAKVAVKEAVHPVVKQVDPPFRGRLRRRCRFKVEQQDGRSVGLLTIDPKPGQTGDSLARAMGLFIWRLQDEDFQLDALDVLVRGSEAGEGRRLRVQQRRKTMPVPRSAKAPVQPSKSAAPR